jgi:hypothetical protein
MAKSAQHSLKKKIHINKVFFLSLVEKSHITEAFELLLNNMREGDPHSIKLFFEYVIGKPRDHDLITMHNQKIALDGLKFLASKAIENSLTKDEINQVITKFDVKEFDLEEAEAEDVVQETLF